MENKPLWRVVNPDFRLETVPLQSDTIDTLKEERDIVEQEIDRNWWISGIISIVIMLLVLIM